jgi:hypothetical protein
MGTGEEKVYFRNLFIQVYLNNCHDMSLFWIILFRDITRRSHIIIYSNFDRVDEPQSFKKRVELVKGVSKVNLVEGDSNSSVFSSLINESESQV